MENLVPDFVSLPSESGVDRQRQLRDGRGSSVSFMMTATMTSGFTIHTSMNRQTCFVRLSHFPIPCNPDGSLDPSAELAALNAHVTHKAVELWRDFAVPPKARATSTGIYGIAHSLPISYDPLNNTVVLFKAYSDKILTLVRFRSTSDRVRDEVHLLEVPRLPSFKLIDVVNVAFDSSLGLLVLLTRHGEILAVDYMEVTPEIDLLSLRNPLGWGTSISRTL
jgi:hypothetical protein